LALGAAPVLGAAVVGAVVGVLIFCFFDYFLFFLVFRDCCFLSIKIANKKYKLIDAKNLLFVQSNFSGPKNSGQK
jgi:hypothetical protein